MLFIQFNFFPETNGSVFGRVTDAEDKSLIGTEVNYKGPLQNYLEGRLVEMRVIPQ